MRWKKFSMRSRSVTPRGVATIMDVLVAQRRLFKSRADQSKARYDYIRDLTNLRVRAGALSVRDIEEIGSWMARRG